MPSKSRRAAARQAQLNRRKRRSKGRDRLDFEPQGPATGDAQVTTKPTAAAQSPNALSRSPASSTTAAAGVAAATVTSTRRRRSRRQAAEPEPSYRYLGSELKRIGVMITVLVLILVALSFVLR